MHIPKSFTTVTTFSKILASILFITFPILGFILGLNYQQSAQDPHSLVVNQVQVTHPTLAIPRITKAPVIDLREAWNRVRTYNNPDLDISFQYPDYFIVEKDDTSSTFSFHTPIQEKEYDPKSTIIEPGIYDNDPDSCQNRMNINLTLYENPQNLSLDKKIEGILGELITETFPLITTNEPIANSYLYKGVSYENPVKELYFMYKNHIYSFSLTGNCNTGQKYPPQAEIIFDKVIQSITLL